MRNTMPGAYAAVPATFAGMAVTGWPQVTIVRGTIVMRDDQLIGVPGGRPCRFGECL